MPNLNFDQAIAAAEKIGENATVTVVITTNQDNGVVSYMKGNLSFYKRHSQGFYFIPEHLSTPSSSNPILALFSDRFLNCSQPGDTFSVTNPFSSKRPENFALSINLLLDTVTATFTQLSHANHRYSFQLERRGQLLIGIGAPMGNNTTDVVYTFAFISVEDIIPH